MSKVSDLSDRQNKIMNMWKAGSSSYKIAEELGVTRSSVMGIVYRLIKRGLCTHKNSPKPRENSPKPRENSPKPRENSTKPRENSTKPKTTLSVAPKENVEELFTPIMVGTELDFSGWKSILEINGSQCRWVDNKLFCALPGFSNDKPWCSKHYSMVYSRSPYRNVRRAWLMKMPRLRGGAS